MGRRLGPGRVGLVPRRLGVGEWCRGRPGPGQVLGAPVRNPRTQDMAVSGSSRPASGRSSKGRCLAAPAGVMSKPLSVPWVLLERLEELVIATDAVGEVVFVNDHARRLLQRDATALLGQPLETLLDDVDVARQLGAANMLREAAGRPVTLLFKAADDTSIPLSVIGTAAGDDPDDRTMLVTGRSEAEIREQINATARQALEERERSIELLETHRALEAAHDELKATKRQLEREMSNRARMEGELRMAQKLEAVGQLAAGIAHEINTPLQYIGDSVSFLRSAFDDLEPLLRCLDDANETREALTDLDKLVEEADVSFLLEEAPAAFERTAAGITRVSEIVAAMKEFSHPGEREKAHADINRAIGNAVVVASNEYKYVADIELELGQIPPIACLIGDLKQVFLNLIVNAAHAIADVVGDSGARGTISVRTRKLNRREIAIAIRDSGCGIEQSIMDRIFDPFFTTKPVGKGTGQGLAIAHNIVVDKHGGRLEVKSTVGKGTTFEIVLPIDEARPAAA